MSSGGTTAKFNRGSRQVLLGSKALTVGLNNRSTKVSGNIDGAGGVKVGTGTLIEPSAKCHGSPSCSDGLSPPLRTKLCRNLNSSYTDQMAQKRSQISKSSLPHSNFHHRFPESRLSAGCRSCCQKIERENVNKLLVPYPANQMRMWEISPRVNSPKNDDPSLWEPLRSEPANTEAETF
jgi:hypothetical protein